jgi:hypothetical protein
MSAFRIYSRQYSYPLAFQTSSIIWTISPNGCYSTTSAYKAQFLTTLPCSFGSLVWKTWAPWTVLPNGGDRTSLLVNSVDASPRRRVISFSNVVSPEGYRLLQLCGYLVRIFSVALGREDRKCWNTGTPSPRLLLLPKGCGAPS